MTVDNRNSGETNPSEATNDDPTAQSSFIAGNGEIELHSTEPTKVVEYYLRAQRPEWADWTYKDYSYDLTRLLEYFQYVNIDNLTSLSSSDIENLKQWRRRDNHIALTTLHGQLANIRVFIRWAERMEIVEKGVADSIEMPDLTRSDMVSYVRITTDQATAILEYYEKYDYASREHAEFALLWAILCRMGGLRSLDLDDYREDDDGSKFVEFTHDPDEDTPLKNGASRMEGEGGEREVTVPEWATTILDDYVEENRADVEDDFGREPLFTTGNGRVSLSTIRRDMYSITRPCSHGETCPVKRDPTECIAVESSDHVSRCPENKSPHPIRRGGIIHQLKEGVPKDTICERADVSRKVLNKHYDLRSKEEARQARRSELRKSLDGYEPGEEQSSTSTNSLLRDEVPILDAAISARNIISGVELPTLTSGPDRAVKGSIGFISYLGLVILDIALLLNSSLLLQLIS